MDLDSEPALAKLRRDYFFTQGAVDKENVAYTRRVEPEFAADRFFDVRSGAAIVLRQLFYRLAGFVSLCNDGGGDAGAR